jgi:hypothetical protein
MLSQKEQDFIQTHADQDPHQIALSGKKYPTLDLSKLASQIQARQKLTSKLPNWVNHPSLFFPASISLEQASSEVTALFKANLVHGQVLDASGGMGIDSAAFAKNAKQVVYVERLSELKEITTYNHTELGLTNIQHVHAESLEFLKHSLPSFDFIYLDPARRNAQGNKVLLFKDCEPNVLDFLIHINEKTQLLLKTSPLLDLERAILELQGVDKIWVVCWKNEVKELLFLKSTKATLQPTIEVIELNQQPSLLFSCDLQSEKNCSILTGELQQYLFEAHPGILKAGFFKSIQTLGFNKISANTHLYSSERLIDKAPGKTYHVLAKGPFESKWILDQIPGKQAHIHTRNFPLKPEEIRKKLKLKDGGSLHLFAYQNHLQKLEIAITEKCNINRDF